MQPGDYTLTSETLRKFVPFDELAPDARAQLIPQADILSIPENKQVSETALDSRYTLYLLDGELALIAGVRLVDTLRAGTPISRFPLSRLRSGQLSAIANTPVRLLRIPRDVVSRLLNVEARAQGPDQIYSPATSTVPVNASRTLAAMEAVPPPTLGESSEQHQLSTELKRAEAEIESALKDKAEATIARRLWASGFHGLETAADQSETPSLESQMANLLAKQACLEEQSRTASDALSRAQLKKAEIEAALRSVDTKAAQEHAKATSASVQPSREPDARAIETERHLEDQHRELTMRLEQLEATRQAALQRLDGERKQLENKFAETRSGLEREVAKIRNALVTAQNSSDDRERTIPEALIAAQERVREEVKARLRQARIKLEADLEQSELALSAAQKELNAAHVNKRAAEQEAKRLAERLNAKSAGVDYPVSVPPAAPATATFSDNGVAEGTQAPAEDPDEAAGGALNARVTGHGEEMNGQSSDDDAQRTPEEQLHAELEAIERKLAAANSQIEAATHATEEATQAKCQVEEQVARHRTVEDELRFEIYEDKEERLRAECQRSEEELVASAALVEAMGAPNLGTAGGLQLDGNDGMLGDIRQQLRFETVTPSTTHTTRAKIASERGAAMVRAEREKASAERLRAKRDLQRARQHLIKLRSKMQKAPSSNSD